MGCSSCAERARLRALAAQQAATAKTVSSATTYQDVKNLARSNASAGCMKQYDQLVQLDTKIIQLWKIYRRTEKGFDYAQAQKAVRQWIKNLPHQCPDEDYLRRVEEEINGDYAKQFGDPTVTQQNEHTESNTNTAQ